MPAKNLKRIATKGGYFHIYNKGIEGKTIFADDQDYEVFISYLKGYLSSPAHPDTTKTMFTVNGKTYKGTPHLPKNYFNLVELNAYSLQPDHFHLVLKQLDERSLESFLRSLSTRYSMYFNKKYKRAGALFSGPYKSITVSDEEHLSNLIGYLHYKSGKYSSVSDYIDPTNDSFVKKSVNKLEDYRNTENQNKLINEVNFEGVNAHLERRNLSSKANFTNQKIEVQKTTATARIIKGDKKHVARVPELLLSFGIFIMLLFYGVKNIKSSQINTLAVDIASATPTTEVLGVETTPEPTASPTPTPTPIASASASLAKINDLIEGTSSAEIKDKNPTRLAVKIEDGSPTVNVRKDGNLYADILEKVKDGQQFQYLSFQAGWYRILLADGTGYISSKYVKVLESGK